MGESKRRIAVRFEDKTLFSRCCVALNDDEVPFSLAGSNTVVLAERDFRGWIDKKAPKQISGLLSPPAVQIVSVGRGGKRAALPTQQQTEALLWKLSKAR